MQVISSTLRRRVDRSASLSPHMDKVKMRIGIIWVFSAITISEGEKNWWTIHRAFNIKETDVLRDEIKFPIEILS